MSEIMAAQQEVETIGGDVPGSTPATEGEQAEKDEIVTSAMDMIYDDDGRFDGALNYLQEGASDPAKSLAELTFLIMGQLDDISDKGLMPEAVLPASTEIITELAQIAQDSGAFPVDDSVLNFAQQQVIAKVAQEFGLEQEEIDALMEGIAPETLDKVSRQQEQYAVAASPANPQGIPGA